VIWVSTSETFDVGLDTNFPEADDYCDNVPFSFKGTLKRFYFKNLQTTRSEIPVIPGD
jgi:hypothetical protein